MSVRILVAVALAERQEVLEVELPEGASVADAIAAAQVAQRYPAEVLASATLGIWSKAVTAEARLRNGDRVEVYRALKADPKDMRRARARGKATASLRSRSGP